MALPPYSNTTVACGYAKGTPFDDTPAQSMLENGARINEVTLWVGIGIGGLEVSYEPENPNAVLRGKTMGPPFRLLLEKDEFIISVAGSITHKWIGHLVFVTNKRSWGPFGIPGTEHFTFNAADNAPTHLAACMGLLAFKGYATPYVHVLQATFAEIPVLRHREYVRLEFQKIIAVENSDPVSTFATTLMSPTVRLCAGRNRVNLYTNEAVVCQLPFFKAALHGGFKEALEKTINMPEDEPAVLAALIEFLYTGKYTYPYSCSTTEPQDATSLVQIPAGSLLEGIFHVGVYAIAAKYDSTTLKSAAYKNMLGVQGDLGAVDKLRLWKAAYSEGFRFPELEGGEASGTERERREWVRALLADHDAELKMVLKILLSAYAYDERSTRHLPKG